MTISLTDVTKVYKNRGKEVRALDGITISIGFGEFVVITGPSGAGKSTLLSILGGLEQPTSGFYTINGQAVGDWQKDVRMIIPCREISFVYQNLQFLPRMSILQNVSLPLMNKDSDKKARYEQAAKALETVGLGYCMKNMLNTLNSGKRQQAAVARALVNDPDIVLADELMVNPDTKSGFAIRDALKTINRQGGTVILATPAPDMIQPGQRLISVRDGRIVLNRKL